MITNPLVVGYKGEIGSFILNGLLFRTDIQAKDIYCVDNEEQYDEVVMRIQKADYIFLCIGISQTLMWLAIFKNQLKGKIIVEQCSLKEWVYDDIICADLDVRPIHILFRPSSTPVEDRYLGLFKGVFTNAVSDQLIHITESKPVNFNSIKEHDLTMGRQQALVHRVLLALSATLGEGNGTYISNHVKALAKRISEGDPTLYKLIQSNKYVPEIMEEFKENLER